MYTKSWFEPGWTNGWEEGEVGDSGLAAKKRSRKGLIRIQYNDVRAVFGFHFGNTRRIQIFLFLFLFWLIFHASNCLTSIQSNGFTPTIRIELYCMHSLRTSIWDQVLHGPKCRKSLRSQSDTIAVRQSRNREHKKWGINDILKRSHERNLVYRAIIQHPRANPPHVTGNSE